MQPWHTTQILAFQQHQAAAPVGPVHTHTHAARRRRQFSLFASLFVVSLTCSRCNSPCTCEQRHPWTPASLVCAAASAAGAAAAQQQQQLLLGCLAANTQTVCTQQAEHSVPTSKLAEMGRSVAVAVVADTEAAAGEEVAEQGQQRTLAGQLLVHWPWT